MTTVYARDEKKDGTVGKRKRIIATFAVSSDAWSYINTKQDLHPTWIITYKERAHKYLTIHGGN